MLRQSTDLVLDELARSLRLIDQGQFSAFLEELLRARRVLCVGVGRVLISLRAWVKRMAHLEIDIDYVGSETERPIGPGDLLIVASSSGESAVPVAVAHIAKKTGARIAYVGCTPESAAAGLSDIRLLLAGRTRYARADEFRSAQPMSTLFEQQLYLLCDILTLEIMEKRGWSEEDIRRRHANLE